MTETTEIKFPATHVAHWATGPVNCCEKHAVDLVNLGQFIGGHVAVTIPAEPGSTCKNCENEAANEDSQ